MSLDFSNISFTETEKFNPYSENEDSILDLLNPNKVTNLQEYLFLLQNSSTESSLYNYQEQNKKIQIEQEQEHVKPAQEEISFIGKKRQRLEDTTISLKKNPSFQQESKNSKVFFTGLTETSGVGDKKDEKFDIDIDEIFQLPEKSAEKYLEELIEESCKSKIPKIFKTNKDKEENIPEEKINKRLDYFDKEINKRLIRKPLENILNFILEFQVKTKQKLELGDFSKDVNTAALKNLHEKTIDEIFSLRIENTFEEIFSCPILLNNFLEKNNLLQFKIGEKKLLN